jgi:hypothetical protein
MVQIEKIMKASPADRSGLKVGDVIKFVDKIKIEGPRAVEEANSLIAGSPGESVVLQVLRDGEEFSIKLSRETINNFSKTNPDSLDPTDRIDHEVVQIGGENHLVIKPYSAQLSHELSLCAGEIVCVQRKHEKGWWEGWVQGDNSRKGWFPSKNVQKIEQNAALVSSSTRTAITPETAGSSNDAESTRENPGSTHSLELYGEDDELHGEEWDAEADAWHRREAQRLVRQAAALLRQIHAALPSVRSPQLATQAYTLSGALRSSHVSKLALHKCTDLFVQGSVTRADSRADRQ